MVFQIQWVIIQLMEVLIYHQMLIPYFYDLEVYDYSINNWVVLQDAFEVYPQLSITNISPNGLTEGESHTLQITHSNGINPSNLFSVWKKYFYYIS